MALSWAFVISITKCVPTPPESDFDINFVLLAGRRNHADTGLEEFARDPGYWTKKGLWVLACALGT